MARTAELGMKAVALTDHGNMFGAIEFYKAAKDKGIKPLIGCEMYLVEKSRLEKTGKSEDGKSYYHLGLIAKNLQGYQNLLKLVSDAHLNGFYYKPRTDIDMIAKHAGGLIGFTGCLAGLIPQHLLHDRFEEARKLTARFTDIFGRENYFVEIQDHGIPEQRKIIPGLLKLAEEFNLKNVLQPGESIGDNAGNLIRNFLDCIKSRETPLCPIEEGHRSTSFAHLANIALEVKERLQWDPVNERFTNNEKANTLLHYDYRSPWKL